MTSPIFAIDRQGAFVKMESAGYESEALLQQMIAEHPDVLHDADSAAGEPRRWLLITREAGIPDQTDGNPRWSLDHLLIDQEGVPTFVEVKRSSDTRIRREVVGQMLDYAANALLHWPVGEIQSMFQVNCQRDGREPDEVLRTYLGEVDPTAFWDSIQANLASRTVRLPFVADIIPIELQRIIEFLNDQLRFADVLGIEVQQYLAPGGELQVLVPRVVGRTARAVDAKAPRQKGSRAWDEASFFETLEASGLSTHFARRLLQWARRHGVDVSWGTGATFGTMRLRLEVGADIAKLTGLDTSGKMLWEPSALGPIPPFDDERRRLEIVHRLNQVPGVELPEKIAASAWAHIYPIVLDKTETHEPLLGILGWMVDEVRARQLEATPSP